MKKSDIISIVLTAMIGVFASWFLVNLLMGNPDEAKESYKNIEVVSSDLAEPNSDVFNSDAINPTIEVYVGDCVDVDQDGSLSQAELVACGRVDSLDDEDAANDDAANENADTEVEELETTNTKEVNNGTTDSRDAR
ncbi:hypothetical protein IJJ18_00015 [Candidatus Saccharibacteria bacterium]|nr:hypothetical protein [Candidatus Saccharibacteria bacterium]